MIAAIDPGHQRTEFTVGGFPSPQHDLVPGAGLGLGPAFRATGSIGRIQLLGDDAFQLLLGRRFQNGRAVLLEMLDIADHFCFALPGLQQLLQSLFPLAERRAAKILAIGKQQIECEEDQIAGLAVGKGGLQR